MSPIPRKTPSVANELGIGYYTLLNWIRFGHLEPPARDGAHDFAWFEADIERARQFRDARQQARNKRQPFDATWPP